MIRLNFRVPPPLDLDADIDGMDRTRLTRFIAVATCQADRQYELAARHRLRADMWERYPENAAAFRQAAQTCLSLADTIVRRRERALTALANLTRPPEVSP